MFRLLGLEPGEIAPTPDYVISRAHPEDRERVEADIEAARREGRLPEPAYRITRPDGDIRVLRSMAAVAEERDSRPSKMVGSVQDITDLAQAQRQTAESLTLMETLSRRRRWASASSTASIESFA